MNKLAVVNRWSSHTATSIRHVTWLINILLGKLRVWQNIKSVGGHEGNGSIPGKRTLQCHAETISVICASSQYAKSRGQAHALQMVTTYRTVKIHTHLQPPCICSSIKVEYVSLKITKSLYSHGKNQQCNVERHCWFPYILFAILCHKKSGSFRLHTEALNIVSATDTQWAQMSK